MFATDVCARGLDIKGVTQGSGSEMERMTTSVTEVDWRERNMFYAFMSSVACQSRDQVRVFETSKLGMKFEAVVQHGTCCC